MYLVVCVIANLIQLISNLLNWYFKQVIYQIYHIAKISESSVVCETDATIAIKSAALTTAMPERKAVLSLHNE